MSSRGTLQNPDGRSEGSKLSDSSAYEPLIWLPNNYSSVSSSSNLIRGDHISVYRRGWLLWILPIIGYYHHGIYMGNNRVIHFTDEGVIEGSFADFKDGCKVYVVRYAPNDSLKPELCIRRANHFLDVGYGAYNALDNNCQHFATEVKTGEPLSDQSSRVKSFFLGFTFGLPVMST